MSTSINVLVGIGEVPAAAASIRVLVGINGVPASTSPTGPATNLPAVGVRVTGGVPQDFSDVLTLGTPADGDVVASAMPTFTVAVIDDDPDAVYTVQLEYAADAAFTAPVQLSQQIEAADGGATLTPSASIPATTYWRARLLDGDGHPVTGWRSGGALTVDTATTATVLSVTWTVSTTATRRIHQWHFSPDGPVVGELVTVYGQGFPANGHLTWGDDTITPESWQLVPASADNTLTARRIDADIVTCEHYEIVFAAPEANPAGALLTVSA